MSAVLSDLQNHRRKQLPDRAADVFGADSKPNELVVDLKELHAKIGQLTLEKGFFARRAQQSGSAERKKLIDRGHVLPISQQAKPLNISRGTAYWRARTGRKNPGRQATQDLPSGASPPPGTMPCRCG